MKVLKFGAEWCAACLIMKPRWKKIGEDLPWLKSKYFEYDTSPEKVKEYNIGKEGVPVFVFLDDNDNELARLNGEISEKQILETIKDCLDQERKEIPEDLTKLIETKNAGFFSTIKNLFKRK